MEIAALLVLLVWYPLKSFVYTLPLALFTECFRGKRGGGGGKGEE